MDKNFSTLQVTKIMELIPHRYPFLLIDRLLEVKAGEGAIALKNVTINENFFVGHFPSHPVMPGVLIIEAMAQAAAAFITLDQGLHSSDKVIYFMSIENAKFRKPVIPGDALYLHVSKIQGRQNVCKMRGEARVDEVVVAEAVFSAMLVDRENKL
ncbi:MULTISPECIES: 3-hydroxyacyl-ACP dehydratase FabZ [unclassified Candidatus Lariskella]|uniref:3-hydroxyacyl-ACP dehydratase FabZ n=1 Tax=unclassified Candidatus Lariskella TaxID=2632605 RepID=UPI0030CD2F37